MPKTRLQECAFTVLMTFVMVYAMVCFNIAISMGTLEPSIFAFALEEMLVMWPIAIAIDLLIVSRIAGKVAGAVARRGASQRAIVFAISGTSVLLMCPLMSLAACGVQPAQEQTAQGNTTVTPADTAEESITLTDETGSVEVSDQPEMFALAALARAFCAFIKFW